MSSAALASYTALKLEWQRSGDDRRYVTGAD